MKKTILPPFAAAFGYLLLVIALYWPVAFLSYVPAVPDSLVPAATSAALRQLQDASGHYPLWQPWVFSGMPTVGAFSYLSALYFPNLVFSLFGADAMHLQLLHLVFAGLGTFLFLRRSGVEPVAAFFGGAAFLLNPYFSAMLAHGHGSQLMTAAYMPWMLWALMRVVERGRLADAGILALIAGFQLQRSHVQVAWYSWLLAALLVFFLFLSQRTPFREKLRPLGLLVLGLACGVAMSAVIYLPASAYAPFSVRGMAGGGGSSMEYATLWSMHPLELMTFIVPGFYGFGGVTYWGFMPFTDYPNYAGILVLLLSLVGAWAGRRDGVVRFLVASSLLSLLLSFGRFFPPVFELFYHAAPLFSRFRVPSMALLMLYLSVAGLAAYGLSALLRARAERLHRPLRLASLAFAALLIVSLAAGGAFEERLRSIFPSPAVGSFELSLLVNRVRLEGLEHGALLLAALLGLGMLLLWLGLKRFLPHRTAVLLFALLSIGDLFWCSMRVVQPSPSSLRPSVLVSRPALRPALEPDEVTRWLARQPGPFRVYPAGRLFGENKFAISGVESVGGYHPAKFSSYEQLIAKTGNLASPAVLRMLNVRYVISEQAVSHPDLEPVMVGELLLASGPLTAHVYRLRGSLPRAWGARKAESVANFDELVSRLESTGADPATVYVVGDSPLAGRSFAPAEVKLLSRTAESAAYDVVAEGEGLLVESEISYPLRWKAAVDGNPVPVETLNGVLRGVVVPAGRSRVSLSYDRSGFERARGISYAAFGLALLLTLTGALPGRRRNS
ncbi:hypothetical protein [Chlorobium sp. N1]|uniref:hypothetical protein n=1 Tax=Chlorobium sp. N1 TaxID=2491138 RepID=UPI00103CA1E0|nr:hypothetical protein [Chlorobium sp. N1]TCD47754.1 hypothetical protein E0L29_05600 [Chlorobium sp. N1]